MDSVLAPAASEPNFVIGKESLETKIEGSVDDKSLQLQELSERMHEETLEQ